jgi:LPXTG-site transpeptidase (sortase) family protein
MIRTWPSVWVGRVHAPARLVGEVVLVALLAATLAFSPRDGVPSDDFVAPAASALAGVDLTQVSGSTHPGGVFHRGKRPVVVPPPPPKPRYPTAWPVQLLIPLLDVHRAVEKVGVDQSGVLQLPSNSWNAGWYRWGPVPGAPGDAVIEGHAGYPGQPMIFGRLATLKPGDPIVVVLADGSHRLFRVVSMKSVPAGSAPAGLGAFSGSPRLTLITCTGHFDTKRYYYSDRLLLEARYVGLA